MVQWSLLPITSIHVQKPTEMDIKLWCLPIYASKFVSNFEIYYSKVVVQERGNLIASQKFTLVCDVVLNLLQDHEGKGHVLVMDNYFTSSGLFKILLEKNIYTRELYT